MSVGFFIALRACSIGILKTEHGAAVEGSRCAVGVPIIPTAGYLFQSFFVQKIISFFLHFS